MNATLVFGKCREESTGATHTPGFASAERGSKWQRRKQVENYKEEDIKMNSFENQKFNPFAICVCVFLLGHLHAMFTLLMDFLKI